ncbi:hypothetical protein JQ604_22060 [Bradyrhizobium jicamae]|uniref:hypothetical protein n=1 Tax=Bradyrhizobium jicamae TaxID=280332 RepID=UPI001BA5E649|nr:hypothetical protein [Bradyrhizobium jicamae]MBR0754881.1 hypothetical protein [Bradyrhizobium jicamae]
MTNSRRIREALLSGTAALALCMIGRLVASALAGTEHAEAPAIGHRAVAVVAAPAPSLSTIIGHAAAGFTDVASTAKPEMTRSEIAKTEITKTEITKTEITKTEITEAEIAKSEIAKPELAKPEITEPEIANAEVDKAETTKSETAKLETAKPERAEPEVVPPTSASTTAPIEKTIVVAALTDPAEVLAPQTQAMPEPAMGATDPQAREAETAPKAASKSAVTSIEILDECFVVDVCVDRFLWALYQRTPKEDTNKVPEQTKVMVKRKGKMVSVTRTVIRLVDADFTWKDPKAAERARMTLQDYVIGGMDRRFKLKLFYALNAAEQAGLSPGITSAFRDDYRQSIASGLKAASNRSFHGGSLRGGYGHGLAADVVSVTGGTRDDRWASSEKLWKWLDANGKAYGVGRPYLNRDPPHLAPTDGGEYLSRRGGGTRQAKADVKKGHRPAINRPAVSAQRSVAKPPKTATSSKGRAA